jgi:hypothetical protein
MRAPSSSTVALLALAPLIVWRVYARFRKMVGRQLLAPASPRSSIEFMGSPATVLAFGLLAGYHLAYAVGLARWRGAVFRAKRLREALTDRDLRLRTGGGGGGERL